MPSVNQNATIYRGADATIEITIVDSAGDALDLSSKEVVFRVANKARDVTKLLIEEPDITIASNVATIPITAAQSAELKVMPRLNEEGSQDESDFYMECYLVESGVVAVVTTGILTVKAAQAARHE